MSTSSSPERASRAPHPRRTPSLWAWTLIPAALIVLADQLTKNLVVSRMQLGERIDVLGSWLQWHFITNPGVAFSLGEGNTLIATLLAGAITVGVLWAASKVRTPGWALLCGMVLGGALGNLWDRLFREPGFARGHVVDFIAVGTFPRFNVADSFVSVGVALAVLLMFLGREPWPEKRAGAADAPAEAETGTEKEQGA